MAKQIVFTGSSWETIAGCCRVVRAGMHAEVAGTTAVDSSGTVHGEDDPAAQTRYILEQVGRALREVGMSLEDVVRTRIYLTDISHWEAVARVHSEVFGQIYPVSTIVQVAALMDPRLLVEIEATAIDSFMGSSS